MAKDAVLGEQLPEIFATFHGPSGEIGVTGPFVGVSSSLLSSCSLVRELFLNQNLMSWLPESFSQLKGLMCPG